VGDGEAERLGVLGGSFNPIHSAHLGIARQAMAAFHLDQVLFVPAGNPPHKPDGLADKWDRLRMVQLAVAGQPGFVVCDLEVRRQGVTYTVDTLRGLRALYPGARLWYIIGGDTLLDMHTWRQPRQVFALCSLIVCQRPGWRREELEACVKTLTTMGADIHLLDAPGVDISATMVRQRWRRGDLPPGWVPPQVAAYMRAHCLYTEASPGGMPLPHG
jgi:nicotinate-nucleotide adenylyltransferase